MANLQDNIQYVKGIGPKKAQLLNKLGIFTLEDALYYYPRDYEDRTKIKNIADVQDGENVVIHGIVCATPVHSYIRKGMDLVKVRICDDSGIMQVTFFNNSYVAKRLSIGKEYAFFGKIKDNSLANPEFEDVENSGNITGCIMPVYPLTAGITRKDIINIALQALKDCEQCKEFLPNDILVKYDLMQYVDALKIIHHPNTMKEAMKARKRMIFNELLLLSCGLTLLKYRRKSKNGLLFKDTGLNEFYEKLPFSLTGAQLSAIQDCIQDIQSGQPMNRLVQGDVGSGKTMIAAAMCVIAAKNGYQSALMVPTEILAEQHMETLQPLLKQLGISCILLTGSRTAKQKREAVQMLKDGIVQVAIGTHALIQDSVEFQNLGLVIADEQHRFGVNQRSSLAKKGQNPHILVMSATPIPRSLALIVYGDLDVSIINELPPGRQAIETYAVGENKRERIYRFIDKQIILGGQVYIVCPLVEDGELDLKSAESYAQDLKTILPHRRIGLIHGKMKPAIKEEIMTDFSQGRLDVLVSTTVIEVGVNVPNATLMVVEDAGRFGLSQLHQLRGRVGRGERQSYCVLFGADKGESIKRRLKILCDTTDGFEIAQSDLEIRGPGDFFGNRQHGLPPLTMADLSCDIEVLKNARETAEYLIADSHNLAKYPDIMSKVQKMFGEEEKFN